MQVGNVTAEVRFDSGTLERIFADPGRVLADAEGFWEAEEAMRYAKGWHGVVGVPVDIDHFRQTVDAIARLTSEERAAHPALAVARLAMQRKEQFLGAGIPHLCEFLPDNPATLDIKVLFAGGLRANAFVYEHAVIDATSKHWHAAELPLPSRASAILNLLVHECWHGGYCENRPQWTEAPLDDEVLYRLLINIQNEGIATYVGYTARSTFPAPADSDYRMLDAPADVAAKLRGMNTILAQRSTLDEKSLHKLVWDEGVIGRAFYIGGAHMARTLDERAGRRALTDTIAAGPVSFFDAYDRVADDRLRVCLAHD